MTCNTMLRASEEERFGHAKSLCRCAIKVVRSQDVAIGRGNNIIKIRSPALHYTFHSSSSGL